MSLGLLTKSWGVKMPSNRRKHNGQKHAISVAYVSHTFPQRCFVSRAGDRGCPETSGRLPTWNHLAWVLRTGREQRGLCGGDEERGLLASHSLWSCKHSSWLFSSLLPPAAFGDEHGWHSQIAAKLVFLCVPLSKQQEAPELNIADRQFDSALCLIPQKVSLVTSS